MKEDPVCCEGRTPWEVGGVGGGEEGGRGGGGGVALVAVATSVAPQFPDSADWQVSENLAK